MNKQENIFIDGQMDGWMNEWADQAVKIAHPLKGNNGVECNRI